MKIIINCNHSVFGVSKKAVLRMCELGSEHAKAEVAHNDSNHYYLSGISRADPILVQIIEELKYEANATCPWGSCKLAAIDIPDDVKWEIKEYDGLEYVAEKHRTWHHSTLSGKI